jgi:hypothetical protein
MLHIYLVMFLCYVHGPCMEYHQPVAASEDVSLQKVVCATSLKSPPSIPPTMRLARSECRMEPWRGTYWIEPDGTISHVNSDGTTSR